MATTTETPTADLDKVIGRIQKLLSRTKDNAGTTEHEADTALKMAQELALKHNLDMAAIEASGPSSITNPDNERVKEAMTGKAMYKWQRQLAKYVAEANFCYHLIRERNEWQPPMYELDEEWLDDKGKPTGDAAGMSKRISGPDRKKLDSYDKIQMYYRATDGRYKKVFTHIFVGRKGNVVTAQLMYQYLTATIEDLAFTEMNLTNAQRLSRSAMSWKEGCADRLCERLASRRRDLMAAHDAKVKADEAERQAARERAAKAKAAATPKQLNPSRAGEAAAAMDNLARGSFDLSDTADAPEEAERPVVDDTAEPWVPEGDVAPEPEESNALVLASVYDASEREANYEIAHGLEPGTLARWRREREEADLKRAEEQANQTVEEVEQPVKQETERQRKARERREAEEAEKRRRRWARESEADARREAREWAKRDHSAYRMGAQKGADIGIDTQIAKGTEAKKLK
jgi:hypothetical protein